MTITKNLYRVAVWLLFPAIFLATGHAVLSMTEGWIGVFLWVVAAVPLCVITEVALRRPLRKLEVVEPSHSLPRLKVRIRAHGAAEIPGRRTLPLRRATPFGWGPDAGASRRVRRK